MYIEEVLYHIDEDYRRCNTVDYVCEQILLEGIEDKEKCSSTCRQRNRKSISKNIQIQKRQNNSKNFNLQRKTLNQNKNQKIKDR